MGIPESDAPGAAVTGGTGFDAHGRRVLAVCVAAGFTTLLDQSVLNITVPALRDSLHAGPTEVQWIVAGYSLAFGLALIPGGRLGDVRGRKPFFLAGLAAFVAIGAVAGSAAHPWVLIAARLLQGVGAGLVNSQVIGTLQDTFTGQLRTRALGMYAVTAGIATALGPPLGGALIAAAGPGLGWRLAFLLNAPFGLLTLLLAVRHLPAARTRAAHADLDLVGLVLVGAMTLLVMLPFVLSSAPGGLKLGLAGGACALAGLFAVWQRHYARAGRHPLVHPALPRSAPYVLGTVVAMAQFGAGMASSLVLAMFLQDGLGLSAMTAAAVSLPNALAMGATSALAWRVMRRFGRHAVTVGLAVGTLCLVAGGLTALHASASALPWLLGLVQLCSGAAYGFVISPNQALVLRHAPPEAAGVAGGILQMSQRISAAICVSAISGIYLRGSATAATAAPAAYWHAALTCAGLSALAALVSLLAGRAPAPAANSVASSPAVREARPHERH
jgi:MFS family permease